ncbi:MAG: hypothetical protein ACI4CS_06665, partial [Candidatus Weimeria sp.]
NRENDSIREFRSLTGKYVRSYMDNRTKIKKRDSIEVFRQQTAGVREEGERYLAGEKEMKERQEQIALFRDTLEDLFEKKRRQEAELTVERDDITYEIGRLNYQKYSSEIYENDDRIQKNEERIAALHEDCKRLTDKRNSTERSRHLQICAREQDEINETVREKKSAEERLSLQRQKNKDNEPERERIGSALARYYSDCRDDTDEKISAIDQQTEECRDAIKGQKKLLGEKQTAKQQASMEIGGYDQIIALFGETEQKFNRKHEKNFSRNILGLYEDGVLTEERLSGEEKLKACEREKKSLSGERLSMSQKLESLTHRTEEEKKSLTLTESELSHSLEKKKRFDDQIEERKGIIRYFDIADQDILDTESILKAARKKLSANEDIRKSMEISLSVKKRELRQLTGEEPVELSDDFKKMLDDAGIYYVFGLKWLSSNNNSESQNRMLVEKFPFLPYSLIITKNDMKRLNEISEKKKTSIPVPFVIREDMNISREDGSSEAEENLFTFDNVSFYVCFNHELLNKKRLEELVAAKGEEIRRVNDAIASREEEYRLYYDKYGIIANQEISRENCAKLDAKIEDLKEEA